MAESAVKDKIVTTGTGASDFIFLADKETGQDWALHVSASAWGDADLEVSGDGTNWGDCESSPGTVVNFVANGSVRVAGNSYYRLNVTTHTSAMTLLAK